MINSQFRYGIGYGFDCQAINTVGDKLGLFQSLSFLRLTFSDLLLYQLASVCLGHPDHAPLNTLRSPARVSRVVMSKKMTLT